ncbi:hypothetical protein CR513_12103, partial [Mucuna pruriens]
MLVLLYKEACLNSKIDPSSLPTSIISLLQDFQYLFPDEVPSGLPPIRGIEHHINLISGATLPNKPHIGATPMKLKIYKNKRMISCPNISPYVVPVLLVPKKDGTWRMCIDCQAINKITIKINEGDEWKIAFKTKYGLYEWLIMPFDLTNYPSTFMRLMNHVLHSFLSKIVVYFDDILTYIKSLKEHLKHLRSMLHVLRKEKLYANFEKCSFCIKQVIFLGFVISSKGMEVDEKKI